MDMGLLASLEALLETGSVTEAAQRMHLSPSAMSRILTRLRGMLGDPLLIRAGRGLVLTSRAEALRPQVGALFRQAEAVLIPASFTPANVKRTFTIRASDAVYAVLGQQIAERLRVEAPAVVVRFVVEGNEDPDDLRLGLIDLDIGAPSRSGTTPVGIKRERLFNDRIVGIARTGHALLTGRMTAGRFAAQPQVSVSRRGLTHGPIDVALTALGHQRRVSLVVPTHVAALFLVADTTVVGAVPSVLAQHGIRLGLPIASFPLPLRTPGIVIEQTWHTRWDADPGHRWLRTAIADVCGDRQR